MRLPLVQNPRAAWREAPRVESQGGVCFFLKPLMLSSTLDTLDALEEATELGALLLFPAGACLCGISACGISQPDSELALELGWGRALASTAGMHHWAATSGSMASPPKDLCLPMPQGRRGLHCPRQVPVSGSGPSVCGSGPLHPEVERRAAMNRPG